MSVNNTLANDSYLPVAWEYREVIAEQIEKQTTGKIFFFEQGHQVAEAVGRVVALREEKQAGVFIVLDDGSTIRIDKIITLYGKIGAAYDAYNAYGNSCMDCSGGYSREELDRM